MSFDEIDLDEEEVPLQKMSCKDTDCTHDLHCFQQQKQNSKPVPGGNCVACGKKLVDWHRVHKRDVKDIRFTISQLKFEKIRHTYWNWSFTKRELNAARRKGRIGIRDALEKRIRSSVGSEKPFKDGAQTPWSGNVLYYAQHATACCCRTCIAEWHDIPAGRPLTEEEIQYLLELACLYIDNRIPDLSDERQKIPPIRKKKSSQLE